MSAVDHKAKAVKHIDNVGAFDNRESSDWPQVNATVAVAEATLHAAEQIRLNTLAILYTAPGGEFRNDWVRKQLDKGLGL